MRLVGRDGMILELHVAGYQFPDDHTGLYDSNWLVVEGHVIHPRGNWSFRDPCLLTYEASALADWLEAIAIGHEEQPHIDFVEPTLSLDVIATGNERIIRVSFAYEALPPWLPLGETASIELPIAKLDLAETVREWRDQLSQFPQRAER